MDSVTETYWRQHNPRTHIQPPAGVDYLAVAELLHYIEWERGRDRQTVWPATYDTPLEESGNGLLWDLIARADTVAARLNGVVSVVTLQRKRVWGRGTEALMQVRVMRQKRIGPIDMHGKEPK